MIRMSKQEKYKVLIRAYKIVSDFIRISMTNSVNDNDVSKYYNKLKELFNGNSK